jgi:hypothetical protein
VSSEMFVLAYQAARHSDDRNRITAITEQMDTAANTLDLYSVGSLFESEQEDRQF